MRRSTILTFTAALFCSSAFLSPAVFAADAGTYRPGNTYNSITANSPDICDMQCSGDAQCRSWNFIRIPEMTEGVCEFNDNISTAVPSEMSVSGNNVSRARASRVVAGKTNTVRVGAPSVTQAPAQVSQPSPTRRIVREPIPQRIDPRASSYRPQNNANLSLTEQQRLNAHPNARPMPPQYRQPTAAAPQRPQFRHSLEEGRRAAPASITRSAPATQTAPQRPPMPQAYRHADPRLQRQLQQRRQTPQANPSAAPIAPQEKSYPSAPPQTAPHNYAASSGGLSAPPGVPPLNNSPQARPSPYGAPSMAGAPTPPAPRRVSIPSELSPRPMGSGDSLFGSLYDDVKVPRPIDPALAADPDAPIPTVSSVPTAKIMSRPLPPVL